MATSPNLNAPHLDANVSSPHVVVNASLDLTDEAMNGYIAINFASDADYTLSTATSPQEWQYGVINMTDTGVVLTATRNVILPINERVYNVINSTTQSLVFKTAAGTGITITTGNCGQLYCDGTNIEDLLVGAGGGAVNIVTDTTPQLGGNLDANSKQIRESKGSDIASASTLTIPSDGNFFDVTGTTTITAFSDVAVGTEITLQFDGVLTLTHHATDLILPTAANITTTAGDTAIFRQHATGDWQCISYQKANGESLAGTAASVLDMPVITKSAAYTVTLADKGKMIACDATSSAFTITLLAAATAGDGFTVAIKKIDATNNVTIDGNASETIDGATTKVITGQYDTYFLVCDGANWKVIAEPATGSVSLSSANTWTAAQRGSITALADGATITPDMDDNNFFSVTLGGNRTLANPTNLTAGQSGSIFVTQDGTGSRTLAYGTYWDFEGGTAPVLSTAASSVDRLDYVVRTTSSIHAALSKAWS